MKVKICLLIQIGVGSEKPKYSIVNKNERKRGSTVISREVCNKKPEEFAAIETAENPLRQFLNY